MSKNTINTTATPAAFKAPHQLICSVTGRAVTCTPAMVEKRATDAGVTPEILVQSYVSRSAVQAITALRAKKPKASADSLIKDVREAFGVDRKDKLPEAMINRIMERGRVTKNNSKEEFETKAAAAMQKLGLSADVISSSGGGRAAGDSKQGEVEAVATAAK